jgi:hypothetical protein
LTGAAEEKSGVPGIGIANERGRETERGSESKIEIEICRASIEVGRGTETAMIDLDSLSNQVVPLTGRAVRSSVSTTARRAI